MKVTHQLRLSAHDAHYGGGLVDGAKVLALFGDVATELLIRLDGDEGLFRAYHEVDFLAPLYAGDIVEVTAELEHVGNTSRKIRFTCYKLITPRPDISDSACDVLKTKVLTTKALGTCVVSKDKQRNHG
jgi:3-aminobutyryl-CoA ammonia-lyase